MADNETSLSSFKKHELILKVIVYAVSISLVLLTLYPFFLLLSDFTGFTFAKPAKVLKVLPKRWNQLVDFFKLRVVKGLINSLIVTFGSTIMNIYFSAMTAHSIYAYKWRFRKVFGNIILALMMIPNVVATSGFIHLAYKFNMINHLSLLIFPAIATPISVVFMRLYLESSFSMELIYSARMDGAGEFRIFNQIVLPILKPAIATQAVFAFASSWNEMLMPAVLILDDEKKTLPIVLILNYASGEQSVPMFISTIIPVIVFLFLSRHIIEGVQLGSVKM